MARRAKALGIDYELHYSGRRRAAMAFVDELAALHGERLHVHARDEGRRNDLRRAAAPRPSAGTQVYACGPVRMLEALAAAHAPHWPEDALRVEHFESTLGHARPVARTCLRGRAEGLRHRASTCRADQTVLAALRAANIDVQSDCEEGLCGSCEVRVLAGKVDHRDVVLTRASARPTRR